MGTDDLARLCGVDEVPDGEAIQVEVAELGKVAVYRVGELYFASDDACTHGAASLSEEGFVEGFKIFCGWHDGAFDLRTGEPVVLPCLEKLRMFAVTVRDGAVFMALP